MIDLLPIVDFLPTLKSPMVGVWRRVNLVKFIFVICVVFLWCSGDVNLPRLSRCGLREDCQGEDRIGMLKIIHQRCNPKSMSI